VLIDPLLLSITDEWLVNSSLILRFLAIYSGSLETVVDIFFSIVVSLTVVSLVVMRPFISSTKPFISEKYVFLNKREPKYLH